MTDLNFPYSFTSGDPAVAAQVNANFAAIKTLLESTKLDGDNIDPAPGTPIPYSALDLSSAISAGDFAAEAVAYADIATPNQTLGFNASAFAPGSVNSSDTTIASATTLSDGFYLVTARCQAFNDSGINGGTSLRARIKIDGATSDEGTVGWYHDGTHDLYHPFRFVVPASITSGKVVSLTLADAVGAQTEVAIAGCVIYLTRLAAY